MYEHWFPPSILTHETPMIIIDDDPRDMQSRAVTDCFESLSQIKTIRVQVRGRHFTDFYYRIGYGYRRAEG